MKINYKRVKYACYTVSLSMSVAGNLPPLLFMSFRLLYGISYSLLGLLVLVNFFTQLTVDLIFSFFSHKFDISKTVKITPVLTVLGFLIYAFSPFLFPDMVYVGLVLGTIVFSSAAGLAEVLISPVIAALPSDDPEREMSKLHSVYAWGVVPVVIISSIFLLAFGAKNWQWLVLIFAAIPCLSVYLYSGTDLPEIETPKKVSGVVKFLKSKSLWICVAAIFLGGAAECTMAQWASSYLEMALSIPKIWGDIFGVTLFSLTLGLGRTLYAKKGKNIGRVLFLGGMGAAVCYLIAALSPHPALGLTACVFTGFCTSLLWPGTLVVASERFPESGVFIYAMMAAGGDLGASVVPQLVGVVTDTVIASEKALAFTSSLGFTPEQLGMKLGMLAGALFPILSIPVYLHIWRTHKK